MALMCAAITTSPTATLSTLNCRRPLGRDLYLATCDRSRLALARHDLDTLAAGTNRQGQHWSLRWILNHLLEETARHNGHADLLREAADGTVGE